MYLAAAKRALVPIMPRARARLAADLALLYQLVPLDQLQAEDVDGDALSDLEFYANDSSGPYVIDETPEARRAVECRIEGKL